MDRNGPREGAGAGDLVAEAEALVLRLGQRLAALIARIEAGDPGGAGEAPALLAALDKALGAVLHERQRRERSGGGTGGEGLDLAAARDEIGRRLARLRAVAGTGELPGGPE